MTYDKVAFKALEDGDDAPIGYAYVRCHMIFDVKIEGFCQKVRLVAGEHMTETPATMNYTSVVSCETDCWDLVITELDDLDVKCGDVVNA